MVEIGSFEAKTHFSDLLRRVTHQGEKFVVTMRGKPVAMLGPVDEPKSDAQSLAALLDELREFRATVSKRGPILKPGETWNEYEREGLFRIRAPAGLTRMTFGNSWSLSAFRGPASSGRSRAPTP